MSTLRKLIAITLLAIFGLPFASALFALTPKSEANLPACCRRAGKHHCMMNVMERNSSLSDKPQVSAPPEKCPYFPATLQIGRHPNMLGAPSGQVVFSGFIGQSAIIAQTESKRRISRDRSRQKRGPPASFSSLQS
jgi:hypothetical protein